MRKTFYELLASRKFDVREEYTKLLYLFAEERCVGVNGYLDTIAAYIDEYYFRELSIRGTCRDLSELLSIVNLPQTTNELDDLYLLCELLIAVLPPEKTKKNRDLLQQATTIHSNIAYILEKTNHELREDKNGDLIVVSKNQATILAAEIVEDDEISFDLIEYNHYALKGNLNEKKKLLSSIGLYIEPILKDKALQDSMYKNLLSDVGFVFNNFHIRHNNFVGPKAQDYTKKLNDADLEKWYDRAYALALNVIIAKECHPYQIELTDLKKNYKWKT